MESLHITHPMSVGGTWSPDATDLLATLARDRSSIEMDVSLHKIFGVRRNLRLINVLLGRANEYLAIMNGIWTPSKEHGNVMLKPQD